MDRNHTYTSCLEFPHIFHFHVKAVIFWPLHDSTSRNPQFQFQLSPILPFFRHHGFRWLELLTFKLSNNRHNSINPSPPTSQKRARSLGSSGRLSGSPPPTIPLGHSRLRYCTQNLFFLISSFHFLLPTLWLAVLCCFTLRFAFSSHPPSPPPISFVLFSYSWKSLLKDLLSCLHFYSPFCVSFHDFFFSYHNNPIQSSGVSIAFL